MSITPNRLGQFGLHLVIKEIHKHLSRKSWKEPWLRVKSKPCHLLWSQ